jgi:sec-independent protein translocase protein TatA
MDPATGAKRATLAFMPGWISPWELLLLALVVLLVFGPKRLPEMGRSLGKGMREFKTAITGKDDDDDQPELSAPKPPETVAASTAPREHDTV